MAQTSGQIKLAPSGSVNIAPFGTALPTTVTSPLNAAFKELGYLSDDGVSVTPNVDTNGIKVWQSAVDAKTVLTGANLDVKIQMMQVTQDITATYFFGAAWTNVGNVGKLTVSSNPSLGEKSMVIDWTDDGGYHYRFVVGRGILTDREAMQLQRTEATAFGVTFHALDNSGSLALLYSDNLDLIPST